MLVRFAWDAANLPAFVALIAASRCALSAIAMINHNGLCSQFDAEGRPDCPACDMESSMRKAIDSLLDAIDDASDGQEAWLEHGPYRLIIQRATELREAAQEALGGLKESYEPGDGLGINRTHL